MAFSISNCPFLRRIYCFDAAARAAASLSLSAFAACSEKTVAGSENSNSNIRAARFRALLVIVPSIVFETLALPEPALYRIAGGAFHVKLQNALRRKDSVRRTRCQVLSMVEIIGNSMRTLVALLSSRNSIAGFSL